MGGRHDGRGRARPQEGHPPGTVHVGLVGPGVSTVLALELVGGREAIQDRTCLEALSALAGMLGTPTSDESREERALG